MCLLLNDTDSKNGYGYGYGYSADFREHIGTEELKRVFKNDDKAP
jgi:hypothetical protein